MAEQVNGFDLLFGRSQAPPAPVLTATPEGRSAAIEAGPPVDAPAMAPPVSGIDLLFGSSAPKEAPKPRNEALTYEPDKTMGFVSQAAGSFASDDNEWLRYAAKSLYPEEPIDKAVGRFGQTQEGRYYHKGDDGKLYEVKPPGWSASNIGSGVGYAIPAATGTAAGILTAPALATGPGAALSIGATAGAGAAGEWLRQGIGDVILGDASTGKLNKTAIATEGALSGVGQGVGAAMGKWASRYAAPDIGRLSEKAASDLYDKADNLSTKITPAEATGLQSQIQEQKRLKGIPQSANLMEDFYKQRNTDAAGDFRNYLDTISPPRDTSVLGAEAKDAAATAYRDTKTARTQAVDKFYKRAEAKSGPVDVSGIVASIDRHLAVEKGSARTALLNARELLMKPGSADELDDTFRGLDSAKKALDGVLNRGKLASETQGLDTWAKTLLGDVRDELRLAIEAAGKKGGGKNSYRTGRQRYQQITESIVQPAKEALAPLLRVNPENSTVVRAASSMLDPATRAPAQIKLARDLIEKKDPQTWNGLVRAYLQQESHAALQPLAKGELGNVPGRLAKAIGDEGVMANLRAALPAGQLKALEDMLDVFRAAGRAVDTNSDTAFKLAAEKLAKRRDMGVMAKSIEWALPWNKVAAARDFFAERSYAKQAEAIARIMTSGDRAAMNRLRSLKAYKASDWRFWAAMGDALTRGGVIAGDAALD